ncbi:hypothetical protein [Paracoccus albus]|uniref:hypothetical protein n=1 Tax=Paracoccus albus TaxID=3017784 RepID=UPI0022F01459|nr:hypothetical protein [Paracoccus albus]WBU59089.1 hypothetical protein PAF20_09765 [Paracoccus albus]
MLSDILSLLDARSFSSPWFWLVLVSVWTLAGRGVLGVPNDVLAGASQALRKSDDPDPAEAQLLLDWLSLQLPRWKLGRAMGMAMSAIVAFSLSVLAVLGFRYQLEMAQALALIGIPVALLLILRLRLAGQLEWVMEAARYGQPVRPAAIEAMRRINRYRLQHTAVSLLSVTVTAFWAARWLVLHPNGL